MRPLTTAGAIALLTAAIAYADVIYVDANATGANNGSSWLDAYADLDDALTAAGPSDEVWVADGTYHPPAQDTPFSIPDGVAIYGGFVGGETSIDDRDPVNNLAILDGDYNGDDQPGFLNRSDNAYRVIEADFTFAPTRLDGVVVKGGYNNNTSGTGLAGGMYVARGEIVIERCLFIDNGAETYGGALALASTTGGVTIRDTIFTANATNPNATFGYGGAVWVGRGAADFERCAFGLNAAFADTVAEGGAVYISTSLPSPTTFTDCLFTANYAEGGLTTSGGAIGGTLAEIDLLRCRFINNNAAPGADGSYGGAVALEGRLENLARIVACQFLGNDAQFGGALATLGEDAEFRVAGSVLAANTADFGGGIYCEGPLRIDSSTIAHNTAEFFPEGAGIVAGLTQPVTIENSVLWGNDANGTTDEEAQLSVVLAPNIRYTDLQGWTGAWGGAGNFDADPLFPDPDGPDDTAGTEDDDYSLGPYSPCTDAGDNSLVPDDVLDMDGDGNTTEKMPLDVYGDPRRSDDPDVPDTGAGTAPLVDMGAAEFQGRSCAADFNGDGSVNTLDVLAFLNAWVGGDQSADFNGDGTINTLDVLAFLNAWAAGC